MTEATDATVVVTGATRHGASSLYTFVRRGGRWAPEVAAGQRAQDDLRRQSRHAAEQAGKSESAPISGFARRQLDSLGVIPYRALKPATTVHLAAGLDIDGLALAVILEAVSACGIERIDVSDIKTVVSQLGSRLSLLGGLPAAQRRHAEAALCREISLRCTSIKRVSHFD